MPNKHAHPVRGLRGISEDLWSEFEQSTKTAGSDRSSTLREFMAWYVGRAGATLPEQPVAANDERPTPASDRAPDAADASS